MQRLCGARSGSPQSMEKCKSVGVVNFGSRETGALQAPVECGKKERKILNINEIHGFINEIHVLIFCRAPWSLVCKFLSKKRNQFGLALLGKCKDIVGRA